MVFSGVPFKVGAYLSEKEPMGKRRKGLRRKGLRRKGLRRMP